MTNPVTNQIEFRGRNNDGSETTATWKAALNTNWSQDVDTIFRIRFTVAETQGRNANLVLTLYSSYEGAAYAAVTTTSSYVKLLSSAQVDDATATTQQISSGTFVAGEVDDNASVASRLLNNSRTEMEYVVQIVGADVANDDTIAFRVYASGAALNTYTQTPTVTAVKAASPITGTLSQTLGALTLSGAGAVAIDGTLSSTLGALTLSSAGEVAIDGTLSQTLGALSLSASGTVEEEAQDITGELSQTLGTLTLSGMGMSATPPLLVHYRRRLVLSPCRQAVRLR